MRSVEGVVYVLGTLLEKILPELRLGRRDGSRRCAWMALLRIGVPRRGIALLLGLKGERYVSYLILGMYF